MQLRGRDKLEAEYLDKLAQLSEEKRREFLEAAGDPPVPERVSAGWWAAYRDEVAALLLLMLLRGHADSAVQHGLIADRARAEAAAWSAAESNRLAREVVANSRGRIIEQARALRADDLWTPAAFDQIISSDFGAARWENLVTTETTRATVRGGETAIRSLGGLSALDVWQLNPGKSSSGPCSVCRPLGGTRRAEWGLIFPDGPPAHPGCVCEIRYEIMARDADPATPDQPPSDATRGPSASAKPKAAPKPRPASLRSTCR